MILSKIVNLKKENINMAMLDFEYYKNQTFDNFIDKQFLDILGVGKSLLRMTFERFLNIVPASNILILTNEIYKDLVLEHLPELSENTFSSCYF